jgi:hypothetical protein
MHHGYSRALVRKAARGARARASDYADSKMGNILHALHLRRLLQGPRPAPRPAPRAPRPAPRAPRLLGTPQGGWCRGAGCGGGGGLC